MQFGIDVSHYQELIDWQKVKKAGVQFAFIKATEGIGYVDPLFEDNLRAAAEAGVLPGTYHFFLPKYDPLAQARHYIRTLQQVPLNVPTLPPCIDLEVTGLGKTGLNHSVRAFVEEVFNLTGRRAILYVSPGFWSTYLPLPVVSEYKLLRSDVDWAVDYPLWLAHYTTGWPNQVYPWAGWRFWQYSSAGKVAGVNTKVDLNLFQGTLDELTAMGAVG